MPAVRQFLAMYCTYCLVFFVLNVVWVLFLEPSGVVLFFLGYWSGALVSCGLLSWHLGRW